MEKINKKDLFIFIALALIFLLLISFNAFSQFNSVLTDNLYGNKNTLDNIAIIEIDDSSINKIGRWPWDRSVFTSLIQKTQDAKVIGIDVSFFEPSNNDSSLKQIVESSDNIVLAAEVSNSQLFKPIFNTDYGYVNILVDSDGIVRSFSPNLNEEVEPFAFQIYKKAFNPSAKIENNIYQINYASSPSSYKSYPAYDVLQGDIDFSNKIVLIGATAPNLQDTYFVPTSDGVAMPGVEIHANIIQNFVFDDFLKKESKILVLIITLLTAFFGFFILSKLKTHHLILSIISLIAIYGLIAIYLFSNFNYLIDLFYFPLSLLVFTGTGIGVRYVQEKKHSAYITDAFSRYLSKDLVSEIVDKRHELKLGGAKREITVFFSDIRSFTSISEKLSPEKLVHLINLYLNRMTSIILKHKGTVDKFIGDAIMALWNAPLKEEDHPKLACESAIEQIKDLKELQKELKQQKLPPINIGCGLHTGEAIIGNMGSEDRFDYTAMGDTVNLASRLEGLTKQYGADIIVSEATYQKVKDDFLFRKLDAVKVKGKNKPVIIYELFAENSKENINLVEQFEKALELYFKSKFKEAIKEFQKNKDDVASKLFIERCKEYIKNPPKKPWDGSFEMKTK